MPWIKRRADEHTCKKPNWNKNVQQWDIWECGECSIQWRVKKVSTWFDQREAPYEYGSLEWEVYDNIPKGWYANG